VRKSTDCSKGSGCYISGAWNLLLTIAQTYSLFPLTARWAYAGSESSFFYTTLLVRSMLNPPIPMLSQSYQLFSQQLQSLYSRTKWAFILLLVALCVSCSSSKPPDVALKLNVQPSRPGVYNVTGSTNLPDKSQITVAAIRYLRPTDQEFLGSDPKATFSILDRQIVEVAQGKWQTTLNLWQVGPDGRFQEAWQLNQSQTGLSLNPATEVSFVATFDPAGQFLKSKEQQEKTQDLQGSLVRFTAEGLPYVQASQTLQIALPVGRRPPPELKAEDINGGWGNRYEIKPEPPVATNIRPQLPQTKQINAPLSPAEFLR